MTVALSPISTIAPDAHAAFPGRNGRMAFSVTQPPFAGLPDEYQGLAMLNDIDLFTLSPAGAVQQATSGVDLDYDPSWAPDGRRAAFTRGDPTYGRTLGTDIFVLDTASGNATNLTPTAEYLEVMPAWSPDGTRIVFSSDRPTPDLVWRVGNLNAGETDLWVMDDDGQNLRRLTSDDGSEYYPTWSTRGLIAFIHGSDISVMRADGSERRVLFSGGSSPSCHLTAPSWYAALPRAGYGL